MIHFYKTENSFSKMFDNFFQDREMIERHLTQELELCFPLQMEYVLRDPLLFGDCRNAISSNNQIRIYEDLIDYDSVFYLFQEVSISNNFNWFNNEII